VREGRRSRAARRRLRSAPPRCRAASARRDRGRRVPERQRDRRRDPRGDREVRLEGQARRRGSGGPLGHREEDHGAFDDRGGARGIDPLGGRAVHPVRRERGEPRLRDPAARRRRAADGGAPRRGEAGHDRRLREPDRRRGPLAGRDRRRGLRGRERLRDERRRGAGRRGRRTGEHRRPDVDDQRRRGRRAGLHARRRDRRQPVHGGDPARAVGRLRRGRAHQDRRAWTRIAGRGAAGSRAGDARRDEQSRRRDRALARLLRRDRRRQAHPARRAVGRLVARRGARDRLPRAHGPRDRAARPAREDGPVEPLRSGAPRTCRLALRRVDE